MKSLRGFTRALSLGVSFCLVQSLSAQALPSANVVDLPDDQPVTRTQIEVPRAKRQRESFLDYRVLMSEIHKIRQNPNQIAAEHDLEMLAKEVTGKKFLFRDTVTVKRNALVSRDMGFWFEPYPNIDVLLLLKPKNRKEFAGVNEFDYLTAKVVCKELGQVHRFEMISVEKVEPFDASADFINFSKMILDLDLVRKNKTYSEFKNHVGAQVDRYHHRLGYVTGEVLSVDRQKNGYYAVSMLVGEHKAKIECHPGYIDILSSVRPKAKISMAVIFDKANLREGFFFKRGCLIRLRE